MLKDGELAANGDDQPFVFEESPSCKVFYLRVCPILTRCFQSSMEK